MFIMTVPPCRGTVVFVVSTERGTWCRIGRAHVGGWMKSNTTNVYWSDSGIDTGGSLTNKTGASLTATSRPDVNALTAERANGHIDAVAVNGKLIL